MLSDPPKYTPILGAIPKQWVDWFSEVAMVCQVTQSSGTTANRPTKFLYPGRYYFDTSLGLNGKPIWRNKGNTGWVDATGAAA
jgi:hypothetical protein